MKILLDTNILLDIALERQPFFRAAARILEASDPEMTHLFITGSVATDLYYVVRKEKGQEVALSFITDLMQCVDVCNVDKAVLLDALTSGFDDFEDAVQNAAAVNSEIEIIVTRNKLDFASSSLVVLEPEEFAREHLSSS